MKTFIVLLATPLSGFDLTKDDLSEVDCTKYTGMCTREFRPICGNDGFGRANPCLFLSEYCMGNRNLQFSNWGQCMANDAVKTTQKPEEPEVVRKSCRRMCPRNYSPICGSDGITYSNECTFGIAQCEHAQDPEMPSLEFVNEGGCMMNDFKEFEEPQCKLNCGRTVNTICGDDGETYPNKCVLNRKNCQEGTEISMAHKGECKKCPKFCTREWKPVCGSDGKTYSNPCGLEVASCDLPDGNIEMVHSGQCMANDVSGQPKESEEAEEKEIRCNPICGRIFDLVCGTDGEEYPNPCILKFKSCEEGTDVRIANKGACKKDCARMCNRMLMPVCGSDGVTYSNECDFEISQCEFNVLNDNDPTSDSLYLANQGPCMLNDGFQEVDEPEESEEPANSSGDDCDEYIQRACPQFSNQSYCGSDRITYPHICHFRKARCKNPDLTIAKNEKICKKKKNKNNFINGRYMAFNG